MTPEEQRIAIAEYCGWKFGGPGEALRRPDGTIENSYYSEYHRLPDYLNDLNAMHEAEKLLEPNQEPAWIDNLSRVLGRDPYYWRDGFCQDPDPNLAHETYLLMRATAAQRAEALLRTINKWKEPTQ